MRKKWLAAALAVAALAAALVAAVFPHLLPSDPGQRDSRAIGPAERHAVIAALADRLNRHYVFADKARRMAEVLVERERLGEYDRIGDAQALARSLTDTMASIGRDVNLAVAYSPSDGAPGWLDRLRRRFIPVAVVNTELLRPDIGYLEVTAFLPPEQAAREYAQALDKLKRTNAIIVDLRHNTGGSLESARLLASYFVDRPIALSEVHYRDRVERPWTARKLGAPPHLGQMYVLTSRATQAAAEDFAYTMQVTKRATVVGEATRGGANAAASFRLGTHFIASIPQARLVSPVTGANWEGAGVRPDVPAPAGQALKTVRRTILTERLAHASNMLGYLELKKMLAEL